MRLYEREMRLVAGSRDFRDVGQSVMAMEGQQLFLLAVRRVGNG